MSQISEILLMQRVRNGVIRYLEAATDSQVQTFLSSDELLNMWEDLIQEPFDHFAEPVFTVDENKALRRIHSAWLQILEQTPKTTTYDDLYSAQAWPSFAEACSDALRTFRRRGMFSEEIEVT